MSNDKVAATMHPRRTFKKDDWVCVTVSENTWKLGQVEEAVLTGTVPQRYLVRFPEDETVPAPSYGWYFAAQVGPVPRLGDWSRFAAANEELHRIVATSDKDVQELVDKFRATYPQYTAFADQYAAGGPTGEHLKAKLMDDPYRNAVDPKDVPPAVAAEAQIPAYGVVQDYAEADVRLSNEMTARLYAELYPQPAPKRRKGLTPGEIGLGMGIVVFIIVLFLFIAFSYRGW